MSQQDSTTLTPQQQLFVDFVASGQLDADGTKISYDKFASSLGVDRTTLYNWRSSLPNFWTIVAKRSNELIERRVPKIIEAMYLKAVKGDVPAAKLLLNQAGLLRADRRDITSNGQDLPIPILGSISISN